MKTCQLFLLFTCIFIHTMVFAQKRPEVKENVVTMSKGERTGFTINIGDTNEKDAVKIFKTWAQEKQKKADISESGKHELEIEGFPISIGIGNVYFLFEESKSGTMVTGFFESQGAFISTATNLELVSASEDMMEQFGFRVEKTNIENEMAMAQKELAKRNDEQTTLEKKNKDLNDHIDEWNKAIEKAKSDLQQNAKDQDAKNRRSQNSSL